MRSIATLSILTLLGATLTTVGCSDGAASSGEPSATAESALGTTLVAATATSVEVASVRTRAGTTVSFKSDPDGELATISVGEGDDAELAAAKRAGGDEVVLYERLAGLPAPAALRDAVARAASGQFTVDEAEQAPSGGTFGLTAPSAPAASGSGLCDIYNWAHNGSDKYKDCYLNANHEGNIWHKADHYSCHIDSLEGSIDAQARRKSGGSWINVWTGNLNENQHMEYTGHYAYAKRTRECRVTDTNGGRKFHFRDVGHEKLAPLPYNPVSVWFPEPW
jgi:hypothetical protein